MLTLMGIAFITVDKGIEAEQALVEMYKRGFIDYIYSKDTDVLVYGGDLLTFIKGKFYLYTLTSVLEQFNITNKQFIHMCCLLENDFSPNVSGITIDTVLKRLDTPLGAKQIVDYIIFNKRLHMDKPEVTEKKVTKDLIEYLRDYDIIEASNRLEKKYTLDQS
jgi:5'-3' exonuclease